MKKINILLAFLVISNLAFSQKSDSLKYHRLLLIGFHPDYYLSDAEQDIMSQTKKSPEEYRDYFRKSIDNKIAGETETVMPTVSLLQDTSKDAVKDLYKFYDKAEYSYANPIGEKKDRKSTKKSPAPPSKEELNQHAAPQYLTVNGDAKFMNAVISDSLYAKSICKKYGCDLILAINQMEIVTNYKSCIDIANRIYQREVLIHYSIINASGKVIKGNLTKGFFPSDSNRAADISERSFPPIAKVIAEELKGVVKN
jgi:hypothetical protein